VLAPLPGAATSVFMRRRRDFQIFARAQVELLLAQLRLWFRPVGKLVVCRAVLSDSPLTSEVRIEAEEAALAVDRAARRGLFRPRCLVRALALQRILERRGITGSVVRIGVRRNADQLLAHAWVEHDGVILGDSASMVANFTVLAEARLARSSRASR
jgi:transglutaminase superfamily protein